MPKTKTKTETALPPEKIEKCYSPGESFWINRLSPKRAEVRNNCLNGLCVGDVIEVKDDHPDEICKYVRVIEKKAEVLAFRYTFEGIDDVRDKFPKPIQEFIHEIEKEGIRFEGIVKGMASLSRPKTMKIGEFNKIINSGPITWTPLEE